MGEFHLAHSGGGRCEFCQGTRFKPVGMLITTERRGESVYTSHDKLIVPDGNECFTTRHVNAFRDLWGKLGSNQRLYEAVEKCKCQ